MKSGWGGRIAFTACLCVLVALLLVLAARLGPVSRLVPMTVAVPTLMFLLLQLLVEIRSQLPHSPIAADNSTVLTGDAPGPSRRVERAVSAADTQGFDSVAAMILWLLGLVLLVFALGFVVAFPVFAVAYLRMRSKEGWTITIAVAAVMWGLAYLFFGMLLDVPMYAGQLQIWLGL